MVDKKNEHISIRKQCILLGINRSTVYYTKAGENEENLTMMKIIDTEYLKHPFYGSRKMTYVLRQKEFCVRRHRVRRLMKLMGITAIYQKPKTSQPNLEHKIYPYLLNGLEIHKANQVWSADITYLPMGQGFMYLVAILDWYSRKVVSWKLSNTMDTSFCIEGLEEGIKRYGAPEIFNTDQGSQFTSVRFTDILQRHSIKISMDGKGRWVDNVMVERLWRSVKYECIYLQEFESVQELKKVIEKYMDFYNHRRPHATFNGQTPEEVYTRSVSYETDLASKKIA